MKDKTIAHHWRSVSTLIGEVVDVNTICAIAYVEAVSAVTVEVDGGNNTLDPFRSAQRIGHTTCIYTSDGADGYDRIKGWWRCNVNTVRAVCAHVGPSVGSIYIPLTSTRCPVRRTARNSGFTHQRVVRCRTCAYRPR